MANTYTQIFIHYVFAVQNRLCLISPKWEGQLYKYMSGIIEKHGHKLYVINGMPDHVHSIISMNPKQAPSDLMYHIKRSSSLWINENRFVSGKFSWQEGFGGFSLGRAQLKDKINYVNQQKEHHKIATFQEEYQLFLKENDIIFEDKFLFKPL